MKAIFLVSIIALYLLKWVCTYLFVEQNDSNSSIPSASNRRITNTNSVGNLNNSSSTDTVNISNKPKQLKVAYCLTGQLVRLELLSKLEKVILPNAMQRQISHLFIYLDNDIQNIKQTYWNYNYSLHLYGNYNSEKLSKYINNYLLFKLNNHNSNERQDILSFIEIFIFLSPPSRNKFHVVDNIIPVNDKKYTGHDGPKTNYESAETRFQNNMRWMNGLRDCIKYVQIQEYKQKWHYDLVVRLRDDSYVIDPWIMKFEYKNQLTALKSGSFRGINDHNLVLDRKYVDTLFRGIIEDYYFNKSLEHEFWGNIEHRISMIAVAYNIPIHEVSVCDFPIIPLRGLVNESYWRLHPLYIRHFNDDCNQIRSKRLQIQSSSRHLQERRNITMNKRIPIVRGSTGITVKESDLISVTCCDDRWLNLLRLRAVSVN